jgi:AbrB family looped-hinge helix DNA binding protein
MRAKNTTRLSSKFQISIPQSVRTAKDWKAGQEFAFIPKGEGVLLVPISNLQALGGSTGGVKASRYRHQTIVSR